MAQQPYFLSFNGAGRQQFSTSAGQASGLMTGAPVITHHSALRSAFTTDPNVIVAVENIPVTNSLSSKTISGWVVPYADDALKAELGWLHESDAPQQPELAMIIAYKGGAIASHRFLIGGKSREVDLQMGNMFGSCKNLTPEDTNEAIKGTVKIDFSTLVFEPGRKSTVWRPIQEMFKDSLTLTNCSPDWSSTYLYTRFRLLETKTNTSETAVTLHIEALPLLEEIQTVKPEVLRKYESSSSVAITLHSVTLVYFNSTVGRNLFTTPYIVLQDIGSPVPVSDGMIRLSMDTIRDTLRSGRVAKGETETKLTVENPVITKVWGRCARRLHMPSGTSVCVTDSEHQADKEHPFQILNSEQLASTQAKADQGLRRQHAGVSGEGGGTLLGPVPASTPITVGAEWGGGVQDMELDANQYQSTFMQADSSSKPGPGITQSKEGFRLGCEYKSCGWVTLPVPVEQLSALTKMYELHTQQAHKKEVGDINTDKDQEAYNEATQLKDIPAHKDNRVDILSQVRFFPLPLRHQHIAKQQPTRQTPVFARIDLTHLGVHLADNSIVAKLHNRSYTGAQLKHFSGSNLRLDPEDKGLVFKPMTTGGLQQTKNVRQISSMGEAVMALLNCDLIMRHLHPCDYGTTAIVRFLLEKINHPNSQARISSVGTVCSFFQSALKANADRVLGPEYPRTYQEVASFFNSMDWTTSIPTAEPSPMLPAAKKVTASSVKKEDIIIKGGKIVKFKGKDVCYQFQTRLGCQKVANSIGDGCNNGHGNSFVHICNLVKHGVGCGSEDHGRFAHV